MSKGPLILWLLSQLWWLYLTPAAADRIVTAFLGQSVTLPCSYSSWYPDSNSMCWGKGSCPNSKCNEELVHTDGRKVLSRKSAKYALKQNIQRGEVSLTISNTNEGDSGVYCCRIEVPGWFNDVKNNIRLQLIEAPTTTRRLATRRPTTRPRTTRRLATRRPTTRPRTTRRTTTTAMTTSTAMLPTTVMTTPDLTTRTPLQTRTTAVLTTVVTTCPLTAPGSVLPTTVPLTAEPSTEGFNITTEAKSFLPPETTFGDMTLLTPKAPAAADRIVTAFLGQSVTLPCSYSSWFPDSNSVCWGKGSCPNSKCNEELVHTDGTKVLSRNSAKYTLEGNIQRGEVSLTISNSNEGDSGVYCCRIEVPGWFNDVKNNIRLQLIEASEMTPVKNEGEPQQVDSSLLLKVAPACLGLMLCVLTAAFLLRGKVVKTNCFQKHTRLANAGESKNALDDMQHEREDEDGLFTL